MIRSTTVICVRHKGKTAMAAGRQVTMGQTVLKEKAQKIRRLAKGDVLAGFAGATSDAFALFARFETKLEEFRGNLARAAIELAKNWRMERSLRQLDALLIVANKETALLISGTGDVVEPDDGNILRDPQSGVFERLHCPNCRPVIACQDCRIFDPGGENFVQRKIGVTRASRRRSSG